MGTMTEQLDDAAVVEANIAYHTATAATYNAVQPHYRAENREQVRRRLAGYAESVGNARLVDLGCGTGFVIDLAVPCFGEIVGVDLTPAMTDLVDRSSGRVSIVHARTDDTGLPEGCADVVTANSFLHHLFDIGPTLREAYRILRPGGVFFSEEDPNHEFWEAIERVGEDATEPVRRETWAVVELAGSIEADTGVPAEVVRAAEYQKMVRKGIRPADLKALLEEAGFRSVRVEPYWFLGQAGVLHGESAEAAASIEAYLHSVLPLSGHLFKYLRVEAFK
jgi:ubiquinone/menaquinone biosynthesis C-methylase UbiE